MKKNIPVVYWTFRSAWTIMHFIVVMAAAWGLFMWAAEDGRAARIWESSKDNLLEVQQRVSNAIPWPWAASSSGVRSPNSDEDEDEQSDSKASPTLRIKAASDLNIRRRPDPKSKVVGVIGAGKWVKSDCKVEDGVLVKRGRKAPTSRWVHIPSRGYVSDAHVSTNTDGLRDC